MTARGSTKSVDAAGARRVHDPREALVRVAPHRQHPSPFALGDEAVLQDPLVARHQLLAYARASAAAPRATRSRSSRSRGLARSASVPSGSKLPAISSASSSSVGSVGARVEERRELAPGARRGSAGAPSPRRADGRRHGAPPARAPRRRARARLPRARRPPPPTGSGRPSLEQPRRLGAPAPGSARLLPRLAKGEPRASSRPMGRAQRSASARENAIPLEVGASLGGQGSRRSGSTRPGRIASPANLSG